MRCGIFDPVINEQVRLTKVNSETAKPTVSPVRLKFPILPGSTSIPTVFFLSPQFFWSNPHFSCFWFQVHHQLVSSFFPAEIAIFLVKSRFFLVKIPFFPILPRLPRCKGIVELRVRFFPGGLGGVVEFCRAAAQQDVVVAHRVGLLRFKKLDGDH